MGSSHRQIEELDFRETLMLLGSVILLAMVAMLFLT